ncbi:MAG: 5-formyltetrahydrofolate cyclo-ligase [Phycisphaeraceae bacterium]
MSEPSQQKKSLRARLRQQLMAVAVDDLAHRSTLAAIRLAESEEFARASAIMIFLPLRCEIDARPLALRAWQQQKTVTVPLVSYQQKHMLPVVIRSLDEPMRADQYGVRVPATHEPLPIDMVDLVVVPGLGFDRLGHRIGRGGGFYDRFLAQSSFQGMTCGYALDEQLVDHVPIHAHDVPLNMLVTDRQTLRFERPPTTQPDE